MDLGIAGKKALVVGSTKETGAAVVRSLREAGADVYGLARKDAEIVADLMESTDVVEQITSKAGHPDIIVHVTGNSMGIKNSLATSAEWAKVWKLNLGVAIDINRAFLPAMLSKGWGRIVHFSSNGVKLAIGNAPYTSAKSAVEGYVRTVSKEVSARGVVITGVSPGPIKTEGRFLYSQDDSWTQLYWDKYVPIKRWGRGSEVGALVAFLCSAHSSYMAGAIVEVDGGMR